MKKPVRLLLSCMWLGPTLSLAQQVTVSGQVRDVQTGELLIGAAVWDSTSAAGTQTNSYGFFSMTMPHWPGLLRFSFVGYVPYYLDSPGAPGVPLDIRLTPVKELDEVIIKEAGQRPAGSLSLPVSRIKSIPVLLGEADVLKALSFTPGISTGTEGSAGLYIRGGTPDQNLILLDEVPVYNVMHLGGFFSVFNPAALKSVELYKGAFPARYGGRLASVIDLTMKDGNNQKPGGEIGLGLLNQNLTIESPIVKDKASFIVSGRISTLGLTTLLTKRTVKTGSGEDYIYRFHDFNAKVNYQLNKTDQLYLSFYNGFDRFTYKEWQNNDGREVSTAVGNNWGNATGTLRYSKMISPRLFARATMIYSRYTSEFKNDYLDIIPDGGEKKVYRYTNAGIRDIGGKVQLDYFPAGWLDLKLGMEATRHTFSPFITESNYRHFAADRPSDPIAATRLGGFADADFTLTKQLKLNAGVRYSRYRVEGRSFQNPEPR